MKNTEAALHWIVGVLKRHDIPFQIGGGFAARLYGAERELADIDIAGAYRCKVFDQQNQEWVVIKDDFTKAKPVSVYGIMVPVMDKDALIEYKKMLARDVDKIDVAQMLVPPPFAKS